jgi:hypothetical protein
MIPAVIFEELLSARQRVTSVLEGSHHEAAGLFLPYAGNALLKSGGIYLIGQATRGSWCANDAQDRVACERRTTEFVCGDAEHTPGANGRSTVADELGRGRRFWRFLDVLCKSVFEQDVLSSRDHWGWSNILKIGAFNDDTRQDSPDKWGKPMYAAQKSACVAALKSEIASLQNTLIYFASSGNNFGIVYEVVARDNFDLEPGLSRDMGLGVFNAPNGNLIAYGPHPSWPGIRQDDIARYLNEKFKARNMF